MYTAISATSETLSAYLQSQLAAAIAFFTDGTMSVTLNTPQEMTEAGRQGVSVWLYRLVRDEQRLNAPPERLSRTEIRPEPLPVRLHYLVTPIVSLENPTSPLTEQTILGRVLQVLHDHPVLRSSDLEGDFEGLHVQLHVRLETMNLEEITRVWEALERSYQLSVSYEVSVVYIHSERDSEEISPVEVALPDYGVITASEST